MIGGKIYKEILWGRNSQIRYNGVFAIGYYIIILNPLPILNRLENETSIIESRHLAMIIEPPSMVHSVRAEFGLI